MTKSDLEKATAELQGFLEPALKFPASFGGQRSARLSYGRLWASIDQTPASGNAPPHCTKSLILLTGVHVKAPSAKVGRSNRLPVANAGSLASALIEAAAQYPEVDSLDL